MSKVARAFYGTLVHSVDKKEPLAILPHTYCAIGGGKITQIQQNVEESKAAELAASSGLRLQVMTPGQFLMPGFIDTHIHASQYLNVGMGYHLQLLDWLSTYTFPLEKRFSDPQFASTVYNKVVRRTLKNGTTTACYFATIHKDSCLILADNMAKYGQRGFVGKVNMDQNSPTDYCESTEGSLEATRDFVTNMIERYGKDGQITPCITPRFAISCTSELMAGLAKIAREHDLPIQTHMSENEQEIAAVLSMFDTKGYAEVYEKAGLLTDKTILAHCVHSGTSELGMMKKYDCGIAHCPNSNISISSGDMDVRLALEADIKVGLGTDVSGGYSTAIYDNVRKAIEASKHVMFGSTDTEAKAIDFRQAFFLATLGGAQVMSLDKKIGNFEVGKEFDALMIDTNARDSPFDIFDITDKLDLVQKFLYCGDDRNIIQVYVAGALLDLS